ncbi:carboxymuconolactone decarboxylase family protein [Chitinophaga sp. GCM10012297]|uniref:Carboxymuconolactone decarboxylase family protein n=1 Tax=Chitinophaga chungangae TaxID=2821488 RepID=A0ABS3YFD1_9BACT|nr:carboxymuconolactone decarboxylase family protein [Chitinophaga chungangae]MBO9152814.1 carboxymuconolactone decarboxylase family protein [Chitinophaga chungangae]
MKTFNVPAREQVSLNNQAIFDNLKKVVGFVPNLYATFAHSENALANYMALQSGKTSLKAKEKEVVNLVVSEVNQCVYCLSAHTAIAKLNGFTEDQILEIRAGEITFDPKLDALAKLAKGIVENRGHASDETIGNFYAAGYNEGSLVDVVVLVGDKIITNYLHALTNIPVDWPLAAKLETAVQ